MGAEGYPSGFNVTTEDGKSLKVFKSPNDRTVIRPTSPRKAPVVMLPRSLRLRAEAVNVRITSISVDPCDRGKRLVTLRVDFGHPHETMTLSVRVSNERDDSAIREFGIARARISLGGFRNCPRRNLHSERPPRVPAAARGLGLEPR
jgi:hypothetical protein